MMFSVFGGIVVWKFGYGKVSLCQCIVFGYLMCEVVIYFIKYSEENGDVYEDFFIMFFYGNFFNWEEEIIYMFN